MKLPKNLAAIVEAVLFHKDPKKVGEISKGLGELMAGISVSSLAEGDRLAVRGW